jgi:4-amino-4-deoxy-L-arabinose transferase-like glycosyltransferase
MMQLPDWSVRSRSIRIPALEFDLQTDRDGQQSMLSQHLPMSKVEPLFNKTYWLKFGTILVIAAAMYLCFALSWTKFSRAEVFFAECAREMLDRHNFITPLYHGQPFFDKPILVYGLIIAMFKVFGVNHCAARIPSIIAALVTVTITGAATTFLFKNGRAGLLAAMALASSFMFLSFAYLCMSDMPLVMFDTITMALLYTGLLSEDRRSFMWWLASASMGLAFLTKGPVGIVLPALSFGIYLLITHQLSTLKIRHVVVGAMTALVIASPWFIAAYNANGIGALVYFFVRENLQRFAGSTYDTHKPFWFMVASFMSGFLPWSVFLPFAFVKFISKKPFGSTSVGQHHELYLWLWIAVVTGFFSLSRGKCDYYVLPAYPAAAMLVGLYLSQLIQSNQRATRIICLVIAVLFFSLGTAAFAMLPNVVSNGTVLEWGAMPAIMLVIGLAITVALVKRKLLLSYALAFCGICFAGMGFATQILPDIIRQQPISTYVQAIRQSTPSTIVAVDRSLAYWIDQITFESTREPIRVDSTEQLHNLIKENHPILVILPEEKFNDLLRQDSQLSSTLCILDKRYTISGALTPGYFFQHYKNMRNKSVLLITRKSGRD